MSDTIYVGCHLCKRARVFVSYQGLKDFYAHHHPCCRDKKQNVEVASVESQEQEWMQEYEQRLERA